MKILIASLICVIVLGCHDHSHDDPARMHLRNYMKLKKKNPDSALIELTQHAKITFQNHEKSVEWAHLVSRIDRAGIAALPDMLQLSRLNLEMAKDNGAPEEYQDVLKEKLMTWEEVEKSLNAEGKDLYTFKIEFKLRVE